jgi:hypothetical protein
LSPGCVARLRPETLDLVTQTNGWTDDEVGRLAAEDEIHVSSVRRDGSARPPVTMWMVVDGGDVYVRAVKGIDGLWYRHVRATDRGHVTASGVAADVVVEDASEDSALASRLDAAYREKYRRYAAGTVGSVVTPAAKASTLRLTPRR